ncbi:MAG TPA: ATP-binding protein [Anaerolineales bacterium]|nr:ATP-binding protein [Anaerolineales bacterium]
MAPKKKSSLLSLPAQGVLWIMIIIVMAAGAIGIPGIWLIHDQLDRQAWELVNQGSHMIQVLLNARSNELSNLAILTAQRPTLITLLNDGDLERLASYMETLRAGADLDLLMVCDQQGDAVIQVGYDIPAQACLNISDNKFFQSPQGTGIQGWLLAHQPVVGNTDNFVVVGQAFDKEFSKVLRDQLGMELMLVANDELILGSFADIHQIGEIISNQGSVPADQLNHTVAEMTTLDGSQYYTIRTRYADTDLETTVLLSSTTITETQRQLTQTAVIGILAVTVFCSMIGIFLTNRISQPLMHLRDAAIALRKGDLNSPVVTDPKIKEIAEVAYALEDARIALQHSLKELQQEKAWGDYLIESVVEGIIAIDRKNRITFYSQGAERITGLLQDQVFGRFIDEIFLIPDREQRFSQCIPAPGAKPEIMTILIDERPLTLAISGARLSPPEVGNANLAFSIRDVSNEEAMRGLLGDFLANITHEFRTPLTAQAVSIELLLDQLPELNLDEIHELLVTNHLGVLSLQNLIDNLLEGASIEAGRFRVSPHPTDLAEVILEVARIMRPLLEKNQQVLQIDIPPVLPLVQADPRRTSQVLVNLLSNAIKWGPQGSEIMLSVIDQKNMVKVIIADQGPGIALENRQKLFTRFGHLHANNSRAEYGAGLGLSVVKAIVESQKGQVGVEDRQDMGALFWFTIPTVNVESAEDDL